jgi:hypothetical protein
MLTASKLKDMPSIKITRLVGAAEIETVWIGPYVACVDTHHDGRGIQSHDI